MTAPTAADIRAWSKVDFADPEIDYPEPTGADPDPLQPVVDQAVSFVTFVTARKFDPTIPALLEPLMKQAARMRTEQIVMQAKAENVETAGDIDMIGSFSAGSYTESRHDPTRRGETRALNAWPALTELLWLLMGLLPGEINPDVDDRRDYWRYMLGLQPNAPAWQVVEVAWRADAGPAYGTIPFTGIDETLLGGYRDLHNPW